MSETLRRVLGIFGELGDLLRENGWIISPPSSPSWWGGASSGDEVVITAILVQRTRWEIVHRVLRRLRDLGLNTLVRIADEDPWRLAHVISGVNYRFIKARRLVGLARSIVDHGGLEALRSDPGVRDFLLRHEGVGEETADSILLFALNIPVMPMSRYARRVLSRILGVSNWGGFLKETLHDLYAYKLMHAGIVTVGKRYCLLDPRCGSCPLRSVCAFDLARASAQPSSSSSR